MAIELVQEIGRLSASHIHHPGHHRNSHSVSTPVHSPAALAYRKLKPEGQVTKHKLKLREITAHSVHGMSLFD